MSIQCGRNTEVPDIKLTGSNADDVQWMGRIVQGDRRAFELLYRHYFPQLLRFLQRMTRNTALMEEIINDTMLVVWQKAQSFDGTCKVSTWVFAIAYRRALKGVNKLDEALDADPDLSAAESGSEPEFGMMLRQRQQAVGRAIETLPVEQRTVVALTYFHGMRYEEIAQVMTCSENTIKTRMFHARRKLKTLLAALMENE